MRLCEVLPVSAEWQQGATLALHLRALIGCLVGRGTSRTSPQLLAGALDHH